MLHILSRTLIDSAILDRTRAGDVIILIEDAVLEVLASGPYSRHWQRLLQQQNVYALAADLEIRGLQTERMIAGIEIVDYQGFVQLTVNNQLIHSWH